LGENKEKNWGKRGNKTKRIMYQKLNFK